MTVLTRLPSALIEYPVMLFPNISKENKIETKKNVYTTPSICTHIPIGSTGLKRKSSVIGSKLACRHRDVITNRYI